MAPTHGFELVRDELIAELQTRALIYRHVATGAELLSLVNDDENKCFGVAFRTPPSDSTGIAHILEHSVLCGSRNYPVKKPFFELIKSSMNTFLNAITYPDKTIYPVASTNLQDFYNLVSVYLDAVFFPKITPEILRQEGWHYELTSREAPMSFKGVVYNEMKGAYSSPDGVLYRYSQQSLFPDTTYGVSSGGDPKNIPDLTYAAFKRFHETLYHPSNARIFFYGDDPPEDRLRRLDAYLSQFSRSEPPSQIALQPRFAAPRHTEHTYSAPADDNPRKGYLTVNWLLGPERDIGTTLALDILSYILLGNAAAPLRKALIDSRLGEDVTGGGYSDGLLEHTFSVGLKGIDPADAEKVEALILDTLQVLARDGLDPDAISAALNTVEFSLRENNTGSFPRGLSLMLRSLGSWLYERDPLEPLRYEAPLAAVKEAAAQGERIFEGLIREFLLKNSHRTRVLLRPDPDQAARDAAEEQARLDAARAAMSEADLDAVIADTLALKQIQESPDAPEDLAKIPTLRLADLERTGKSIPSEETSLAGAPLLLHDLFTNGIVYLDLAFDLRALPAELLPYAPLFARALTEMGTSRESFVRLIQRIGRDTGGIYAAPFTATNVQTGEPFGRFLVRGKATMGQAGAMLAIMRDILTDVRLDDKARFHQIVLRAKAGKESSLVPSGNAYARKRLAARFAPAEWADEQMGGISSLFFVRELAQQVEQDWPTVLAKLEAVRQHLVNRGALLANLTLDAQNTRALLPELEAFIGGLPAAPYTPATWQTLAGGHGEGLTIPAKVNYVAKGVNLYAHGVRPGGAAGVVTRYLNIAYYLEKIRVQGGAYGAGGGFDRATGSFLCASYRDPNLLGTLAVYDETAEHLRGADLDETSIERSIIGTIGDIDSYQLPDAKGYTAMVRRLNGVSDAYRQQIREAVLGASRADYLAFAEAAEALRDHGEIAVIGSPEAIEAANRERPDLLRVTRVL